jgi:meso-butanediol dehydrogenase/(S,S)-butanediol dehydrogenase/diacetyl reductase
MANGRLQNKVAIITGSTQGIGEAVAIGYAREGAKVIVCGRGAEKGQRVTKAIKDAGGEAHFIQFDLSDEKSVVGLVQKAISHYGDLHIVVHNAHPTEHTGGGARFEDKVDGFIGDLSTEAWRKVTLPTFDGMFWVLREALRAFKKRGGGTIVNMSSLVSLEGLVGVDMHTATKGAMNALTRSIAVEYGPTVRINTIVVGLVGTAALRTLMEDPITGPALAKCTLTGRIGQPRDFVGPAIFLASDDEAAFVTGQCLCVDGGMGIKMPMPAVLTGGGS